MKKTLIAVVIMAVAIPGMAQVTQKQAPAGNARRMGRDLISELKLTDKQLEKIQKIRIETRKAETLRRANIQVLRMDLGEELKEDKINMDKVKDLVKKIEALVSEGMLEKIEALVRIKAILTDEQKQKLKAMPDIMPLLGGIRPGIRQAGGRHRRKMLRRFEEER